VAEGRTLIETTDFQHGAFTHGKLVGVDVVRNNNNSRLYLQFQATVAGEPVNRRIHAQHINHVTSALTYVGERISFGAANNEMVESITMTGGIPFLNTESGTQINFLNYLAARGGTASTETETESETEADGDEE
jgi:hypothetical protein